MSWSVPFQKSAPKRESELLSSDLYKRLQESRELDKQTDAQIDEYIEQSILEGDIQAVISGSGQPPYQKRAKPEHESMEHLDARIHEDLKKVR